MIAKIKAFWLTLKDWVIYAITPIAFAAGFIYYLFTKNQALQDKVDQSEAGKKLEEIKDAQDTADVEAGGSFSDYERIRNDFLRAAGISEFPRGPVPPVDKSSGQGSSGSTKGDQPPGSSDR